MFQMAKRVLLACFGLLIVLVVGVYLWLNPGRGPREHVDPYARGWAEEVDGTLVLHLKGTPYEIGYQRGYFGRDKVRLTMDIFDTLLKQAQEEMGLPRFAVNLALDATYQLCAPHIPERYKREMEGLADATGFDLKTIRRGQILSVLTERGCSSFAVWGRATADGALFHGHNFDWITSAGLEDTGVLFVVEPEGLHPYAAPGYAGLIGVLSGMNMEGLSVGMIGAITEDKSLRGLPLELTLRRVLEECGDLDEVTALIKNVRRTVGFNYVVADGDARDARVYETTHRHVVVFGPNDPRETVEYAVPIEDAVFRSDEAMDPLVRSLQRCANAPNLPYGSNSYDHRYLGIANRVREHYGAIDQNIALEILKATAMRNANLHAMLTNSTTREMWVARAVNGQNASEQRFVRYDLNRLFLRPDERPAPEPELEDETDPGTEQGVPEGEEDAKTPTEATSDAPPEEAPAQE